MARRGRDFLRSKKVVAEPSRVDSLVWAFSSVVERFVDIEKAIGSIPITPTEMIGYFNFFLIR